MRNMMLAFGAMSLLAPAAVILPTAKAEAKSYEYKADQQRRNNRQYREWRGRDGKRYCRKPDGTTGLVVGAVGGALVGRTIDTRGDRTGGTVLGAVAGALAGREIERAGSNNNGRRCR
ncbi:glycine zipper 2TM domain-containing protein [Sphingomonas sp. M1-B02]|uniref:glycine zipper 2TM domain-containing protein n=1 Tax=Sphingomonas sp. M1-B02 TaxID=3114300 RepID=UPI00223EF617|nr:glycine zipper 2TM domain-containing protein [Sphingomonas sp. S6-11]UZK65943.1 glycine zipper 2TM domain-containing protein [Sphingomonas sp. S6-11]